MTDGLSIADAMALRDNNGFGGGNGWGGDFFLVILFLFMFGNNGFGQHGFGGAATAATQQEILLGQQFEGVHNKLNDIGQGICDSTFALNNTITNEGRALQSQIATCCCNSQLLGKDIMAAVHAEGEATRAMFRENEIQSLRDKVADLQLKSSQCDQNAYLVNQLKPCPIPAYVAPNPYCNYNCCGGNFQPNI